MIPLRIINNALILLILMLGAHAVAEDNAEALFESEKWAEAAVAYEGRVAENPEDTTAWIRLAVSARKAERYETALKALQMAEEQGFAALQIDVDRVRIDVLQGNIDEAMVGLAALVDGGFTALAFIRNDPTIGSMAGSEAFDQLLEELEKVAYPCENDPLFSQFDFWIGEWEVHGSGGQYAGSNVITREQRGCYLSERWVNASGGEGHSINYVDKITDEWVQVWNDASGGQINTRGGLTDDGMSMVGTLLTVGTNTVQAFRALFTPLPDGRVRQFFEVSDDDGETWAPWFEGFYSRKTD
jgi:hypothetical protein